jgi:hypothetical protein
VFPNSQASSGSNPADETPIVANVKKPTQLLTGANDYNCASLQGYYATGNLGGTWKRSCGTALSGQSGLGDPIVGYDLNSVAYRGGINSPDRGTTGVIVVGKSTDNGTTWSAPVQAVPNLLGGLADKPWLEIDTNATSPRKNTFYVSATQFDTSGSASQISVSHSTDRGLTWTTVTVEPAQAFPTIDQFTDLSVGRDGTVYLTWMRCHVTSNCAGNGAKIMFSKSTDGGATWSKAKSISAVNLVPGTSSCYYGCLPNTSERVSNIPIVAVDASGDAQNGKLYVVDYTWTGTFMKVQVISSTDGGATWSAPVRVTPASDKHDQFFPWVNVDQSNGWVGVSWLARRDDPANVSYNASAAASKDFGATYPNVKISAASSNPGNDGFGGGFIGDYTGNTWSKNSLIAAWTDTSAGPPSQDVVGGINP